MRPKSSLTPFLVGLIVVLFSLLIGAGALDAIGDENIQNIIIFGLGGVGFIALIVGADQAFRPKTPRGWAISLMVCGASVMLAVWFAWMLSFSLDYSF